MEISENKRLFSDDFSLFNLRRLELGTSLSSSFNPSSYAKDSGRFQDWRKE